MTCRQCDDEQRCWWDCPHGSAQPAERPDPLLRGFAFGGLLAIAAFGAIALVRQLLV